MLFVHQIHRVAPGAGATFDSTLRDTWLPAVASLPGLRLAWSASATPISRFGGEVATITAVEDASALALLADEVRSGSLRDAAVTVASLRDHVETRLLQPIDYDPWGLSIDDIPGEPQDGPSVAYMHDFVPPVTGQMTGYIDMMRERYMALSEQALSGIVLKASWQTVSGGGQLPEMFNLSEIRDLEALLQLLAVEIPREYKEMGSWMWEALATRDRWTTRLLRSASWSPVR